MLRSEGPLTDNAFIIPSVTWYVQASSSKQPPKFLNLFYHTLEGAEGRGGEEMLKNLSAKQALAKSSLGIDQVENNDNKICHIIVCGP